jgi:phospholipase/carboxylesterase
MTTQLNNSTLSCIELNPKTPPQASVIWLHGLGADGHDFAPIVDELNLSEELGLRFIFPHAPFRAVTINQGYTMRAWYDIRAINIDREIDEVGMNESLEATKELIAKEIHRGIPENKIILAGFSQGAVIALLTGLSYPHNLGGVIALSGYLPEIPTKHNAQTPIFLAHGTEDPVVPYTLGLGAGDRLKRAGCNVDWHSYPMGHSVCREEIVDIKGWIEKTIS